MVLAITRDGATLAIAVSALVWESGTQEAKPEGLELNIVNSRSRDPHRERPRPLLEPAAELRVPIDHLHHRMDLPNRQGRLPAAIILSPSCMVDVVKSFADHGYVDSHVPMLSLRPSPTRTASRWLDCAVRQARGDRA